MDPDGTFYIQLVAREEDLSDLSDKLEEALASAETGDLSVAPVGAICCAMFTEDDAWYRAKVTATDADKGQVSVRFVDYGNTDTVEADRLTSLPEDLKLSVLPAFATKSRLSGVSDLSDDAVEKLKEAVLDQVVIVDVKIKVEDHDEVELKVAGTLLTDILGIQVAKTESKSNALSLFCMVWSIRTNETQMVNCIRYLSYRFESMTTYSLSHPCCLFCQGLDRFTVPGLTASHHTYIVNINERNQSFYWKGELKQAMLI